MKHPLPSGHGRAFHGQAENTKPLTLDETKQIMGSEEAITLDVNQGDPISFMVATSQVSKRLAELNVPRTTTRYFKVTITAAVTKTYTVDASDEDEAVEQAKERFDLISDEHLDKYEESTDSVEEIKKTVL